MPVAAANRNSRLEAERRISKKKPSDAQHRGQKGKMCRSPLLFSVDARKSQAEWRAEGFMPIKGARPSRASRLIRVVDPIPGFHQPVHQVSQEPNVWDCQTEAFVYSPNQVQKIEKAKLPKSVPVVQEGKSDFHVPKNVPVVQEDKPDFQASKSAFGETDQQSVSYSSPISSIINSSPSPPYDGTFLRKGSKDKDLTTNDRKARKPEEWEYLPEGFQWETVPTKLQDGLRYLFHLLYINRIIRHMNEDDFININARTFEEIVWNGHAVRKYAINAGLVECDGVYAKGSKSYGYRLSERFRGIRFRYVRRKSRAIIDHLKKSDGIRKPVVRHLATNLRRVDAVIPQGLPFGDELALLAINEGCVAFNPEDDFGRRFHSNLTNLATGLRQYLRVDGKPLFQIDIKNSQPLFLVVVTEKHRACCPKYRAICEEGRLYEFLGEKTGLSRADSKEELITRVFFGRNGAKCKTQRAFAREFPETWQAIRDIKQQDYTELARQLQQAESDFVIRRVCDRIRRDHPKMFVATIHDSVITNSPEDAEVICCIMRAEFNKMNLNPKLEIEPLCP